MAARAGGGQSGRAVTTAAAAAPLADPAQFYQFLHEMEKAKSNLEIFS